VEESGERLQKVMAQAGVASRRSSEDLIRAGQVKVNGQVVTELGSRVDPRFDVILVAGKRIALSPLVYYVVNKPVGYVSTASDEQDRKTVLDLVPPWPRVYPVGRLDMYTSGLMILTDDGDLAYALTHPKFEVPKVYVARVGGLMTAAFRDKLLKGVVLDDGPAAADDVQILELSHNSLVQIRLHEGRNRIVRRMLSAIGVSVRELRRTAVGPLTLGDLKPGSFRRATGREVGLLYGSAGQKPAETR